jgi:hypothetical protein
MMTQALFAGAMLLLASTPSQPATVNQYITDTGNPDLKEAMEAYAIGVGHGVLLVPSDDGAAMLVPPPGLFSITTCCPQIRDSLSAVMRATVSVDPPGA